MGINYIAVAMNSIFRAAQDLIENIKSGLDNFYNSIIGRPDEEKGNGTNALANKREDE